jgi:hypothetical protein
MTAILALNIMIDDPKYQSMESSSRVSSQLRGKRGVMVIVSGGSLG